VPRKDATAIVAALDAGLELEAIVLLEWREEGQRVGLRLLITPKLYVRLGYVL
jgi:hypothetical protein